MNAFDYLLKSNLYGLLFVGCYWLFLRRHTFFKLNRAYLVASVVLSLIVPLMSLPAETLEPLPQLTLPTSALTMPVTTVTNAPVNAVPVNTLPDWEQLGLVVYGLIAVTLLVRLGLRINRLMRLIRHAPQQAGGGFMLVKPNDSTIATFSFFHFLVLNPADTDNDLIIRHELVHIRQWHSADVVGLAILRAIFWAFPTLWLTDRLLRQVHEFLADKQTHQPTEYARFLFEYSFGLQTNSLTNGFFNPSLLKLRIQMLHQRATARWALGKYVLVLPLVFGLLAMTTAREQITDVVNQAADDTTTVSGKVSGANGKPLVGAIVSVASTGKGVPTDAKGRFNLQNVPKTAILSISFEGYTLQTIPVNNRTAFDITLALASPDELPTMGATKAYKAIKPNPAMPIRTPPSSETINGKVYTAVEEPAVFPTGIPGLMQYIAHALQYPAKAKSAGIQGRVLVQFVVLPTGAIGSVTVKKGLGSGCDEEAVRVVRQMPRWIPGKQNGQPVATQFVLPIQFELEKKEDKRTGQVSPTTQPDSTPKFGIRIDNSKNGRYGLYGDGNTDSQESLRYAAPRFT